MLTVFVGGYQVYTNGLYKRNIMGKGRLMGWLCRPPGPTMNNLLQLVNGMGNQWIPAGNYSNQLVALSFVIKMHQFLCKLVKN